MDQNYIAGVDIGGTRIRVAISSIDLKEESLVIKTISTPKENRLSISSAVCRLIFELLNENQVTKEQILGIGIATAGPLDIKTGEIFNNANLGFREIPQYTLKFR